MSAAGLTGWYCEETRTASMDARSEPHHPAIHAWTVAPFRCRGAHAPAGDGLMEAFLRRAVAQGMLRALDLHFARRMEALAGGDAPELLLAAALVSHRVGEGDVCLDLERCRELPLLHDAGDRGGPWVPTPEVWIDALGTRSVVGKPGGRAPLILDRHGRLYLGRYWWFERQVTAALLTRVRSPPPTDGGPRSATGRARAPVSRYRRHRLAAGRRRGGGIATFVPDLRRTGHG